MCVCWTCRWLLRVTFMWGPSEKLPENAELPTPRQELDSRPSLRPVHTSFLWDSEGEMGGAGPPGRLAPGPGTGTSGQQGQWEGPLEPGEQAGHRR